MTTGLQEMRPASRATPAMRRGFAPFTLVLLVVLVIWIASGVGVADIAKFTGYEVGFVLLPGAALLWALRGRRFGTLVTIALGWPLGQALEVLAFSATAAIGARGLFVIYPVVVIVPCASFVWRRTRPEPHKAAGEPMSSLVMWFAASALSLGVIYLALAFLPQVPLPSTTHSVAYYVDFPNFIGLTAEVRNHWPATSPGLSGYPLHYEWFVFDHMAAINQVTGVSIPMIGFRLDVFPTILVFGCQLFVVGRFLGSSVWTGALAIVVAFLLGALDLTADLNQASPFFDQFNFHLWASWTFPFGLMFFMALLYLIAERLQATSWRGRDAVGAWVVIALIMVGASGAKATVLPVVIAGVGLYAVWDILFRRTVSVSAVATLVLGVVVFAATFLIVYGKGVPGTMIDPLVPLSHTVPVTVASSISSHAVRTVALPIAYVAGLAGIALPLAGILYLLTPRHRDELARLRLCLFIFAAGILIANAVHQIGASELYFLDTGYPAAVIVGAAGLRLAWNDLGRSIPVSVGTVLLLLAGWICLIILVVVVTAPTLAHPAGLLVRYAALGLLGLLFILATAMALRSRRAPLSGVVALGLIPLVAASLLTSPIQLASTVDRVLTGKPITVTQPDPQAVRGLTPGLVVALNWLQDNTPVDTIFAVSNHWVNPGMTDGRYYYYSAFSERQVFVEAYNPDDYGLSNPPLTPPFEAFLHRVMLNDAVFDHADAAALRILTDQYGVRYLLIDRLHHNADPALLQLGRIVLTNSDATIVAVS
ncbi:MAG: hypothetical protein ACHQ4F_12730 [Candidatus Dormibacteria bacterium]